MTDSIRIVIASDHAGFTLKETVFSHLRSTQLNAVDLGVDTATSSVDFPDFAHLVSQTILNHKADLGILVCGSGIGMSIAANRHKGIRAALCTETYAAIMARKHNDANVLCLGSRIVGSGLALAIVDAFLAASFEGGRHELRIRKMEIS